MEVNMKNASISAIVLMVSALLTGCGTSGTPNLSETTLVRGQVVPDEIGLVVNKQKVTNSAITTRTTPCKTKLIIRPKANMDLSVNFHYFSDRTLQPMFLWWFSQYDTEQQLDQYCFGGGNFVLKNPATGYAPNFNIPTFPDKLFAYLADTNGLDLDQVFTVVNNSVPFKQIRHYTSGLCWQIQSTSINSRILMKACDSNNIMQLFAIAN
jgi:hypothetical protein